MVVGYLQDEDSFEDAHEDLFKWQVCLVVDMLKEIGHCKLDDNLNFGQDLGGFALALVTKEAAPPSYDLHDVSEKVEAVNLVFNGHKDTASNIMHSRFIANFFVVVCISIKQIIQLVFTALNISFITRQLEMTSAQIFFQIPEDLALRRKL